MRFLIDMKIFQIKLSYPFRGLRTIILCFLPVLFWSHNLPAESIRNSDQEQETKLVWSANYGQGEQVYFSSYEKDNWTNPVQLSDSAGMVFHSAVSSGNDGRIWVVWSRQEKKRSFLEFTFYSSSGWTQPLEINTGMDSNIAVSVIVDKNNTPWIAWSGIEKMYSDVFWSRWNGQGWDLPVKAHTDNDVPDIDSKLVLDDSGHIVLFWRTFANGKYVTVSKIWDGKQWQIAPHDSEKKIVKKIFHDRKNMPPIPEFIQERHNATLFIKGNDGAWSISLSNF